MNGIRGRLLASAYTVAIVHFDFTSKRLILIYYAKFPILSRAVALGQTGSTKQRGLSGLPTALKHPKNRRDAAVVFQENPADCSIK